jgi:hypothetical protein
MRALFIFDSSGTFFTSVDPLKYNTLIMICSGFEVSGLALA